MTPHICNMGWRRVPHGAHTYLPFTHSTLSDWTGRSKNEKCFPLLFVYSLPNDIDATSTLSFFELLRSLACCKCMNLEGASKGVLIQEGNFSGHSFLKPAGIFHCLKKQVPRKSDSHGSKSTFHLRIGLSFFSGLG